MIALAALVVFGTLSPAQAGDAAVAVSPSIAVADAQVRQNAATLGAARSALVPSLASSYVQTPQGNPPGPNVISRLVTVGLQETLTDFLSYGSVLRQAALTLTASRADRDVAIRDERIKTVQYYYDALKARSTVTARSAALASARASDSAATLRFTAGDAPRLDVLRAEVAVARAEADLESSRVAEADADQALLLETGLPESTDLQTTREATTDTLPAAGVRLGSGAAAASTPAAAGAGTANAVVTNALANRAEIASLSASTDAAGAGRRVIAGGAFPVLLVGGGYTAGTDSGVPIGAPSLTASVLFPLGAGAHDRIAAEDAKIAAAKARFEAGRRAIMLEVATSVRSVASLERTLDATQRESLAARAELTATELGYRSGASSSLDVEVARTADTSATIARVDAEYNLAKAHAVLALEIGR